MAVTDELKTMIWQTVAAIPEGRVSSYGDIAKSCGYPRHARFVGTTLKRLPPDSLLPWHRVIKADGQLAFPIGTSAYHRQRQQLEQEGVVFIDQKVCMKKHRWSSIPV